MRKRNSENKGLPARWRWRGKSLYYQVPPAERAFFDDKVEFRLGESLSEAMQTFAQRRRAAENAGAILPRQKILTVADLLNRYEQEVIPLKSLATQRQNRSAIKRPRNVFGSMAISALQPMHIYEYFDRAGGTTGASREIEIISHAYTKAVEWGIVARNPFIGQVRLKKAPGRDRYVEDWEIAECLSITPPRKHGGIAMLQCYIRLKLLTGLRQGDLLRLQVDQLRDDGIYVKPQKTAHSSGRAIVIIWTDELRAVVRDALEARPRKFSDFVFCNLQGKSYYNPETARAGGFESLWRDFMTRVLAETSVTVPFTENDLRAKAASDADNVQHASALLAHSNTQTTQRFYRRKPEEVKPVVRKGKNGGG
ncbi:tyrosine-type recombinase/integrase [Massilia sp. W12]|uniref:tyrosine-type recombinase/integrase n=1 Tax=Massilia sp. W12 TaxID=3126507 RepID=UPI0030CB27CA